MRNTSLIKFCVGHAAFGVGIAFGLIGLMLAFDVANLWTLVMANDMGFVALAIMTVFFSITFGSVQIGIALMTRQWDDDGSRPRRMTMPVLPQTLAQRQPVPVRIKRR